MLPMMSFCGIIIFYFYRPSKVMQFGRTTVIANTLKDSNPSIASLLEMSVSPNLLKRQMRSIVVVLGVLADDVFQLFKIVLLGRHVRAV
jgi:hypothetical protein